jgi:hypothetical protein
MNTAFQSYNGRPPTRIRRPVLSEGYALFTPVYESRHDMLAAKPGRYFLPFHF